MTANLNFAVDLLPVRKTRRITRTNRGFNIRKTFSAHPWNKARYARTRQKSFEYHSKPARFALCEWMLGYGSDNEEYPRLSATSFNICNIYNMLQISLPLRDMRSPWRRYARKSEEVKSWRVWLKALLQRITCQQRPSRTKNITRARDAAKVWTNMLERFPINHEKHSSARWIYIGVYFSAESAAYHSSFVIRRWDWKMSAYYSRNLFSPFISVAF